MLRFRALCRVLLSRRRFVTEGRVDDWGWYPDTARRSVAEATQLHSSRIGVDDSYEPQIFRLGVGSERVPNVVPVRGNQRLIACTCSPSEPDLHYMMLEKGARKRCPCGHWFVAVASDDVRFVREQPFY